MLGSDEELLGTHVVEVIFAIERHNHPGRAFGHRVERGGVTGVNHLVAVIAVAHSGSPHVDGRLLGVVDGVGSVARVVEDVGLPVGDFAERGDGLSKTLYGGVGVRVRFGVGIRVGIYSAGCKAHGVVGLAFRIGAEVVAFDGDGEHTGGCIITLFGGGAHTLDFVGELSGVVGQVAHADAFCARCFFQVEALTEELQRSEFVVVNEFHVIDGEGVAVHNVRVKVVVGSEDDVDFLGCVISFVVERNGHLRPIGSHVADVGFNLCDASACLRHRTPLCRSHVKDVAVTVFHGDGGDGHESDVAGHAGLQISSLPKIGNHGSGTVGIAGAALVVEADGIGFEVESLAAPGAAVGVAAACTFCRAPSGAEGKVAGHNHGCHVGVRRVRHFDSSGGTVASFHLRDHGGVALPAEEVHASHVGGAPTLGLGSFSVTAAIGPRCAGLPGIIEGAVDLLSLCGQSAAECQQREFFQKFHVGFLRDDYFKIFLPFTT